MQIELNTVQRGSAHQRVGPSFWQTTHFFLECQSQGHNIRCTFYTTSLCLCLYLKHIKDHTTNTHKASFECRGIFGVACFLLSCKQISEM